MSTFETTSHSSHEANNELNRIVVKLSGLDGVSLPSDGVIKFNTALRASMKGKDAKQDSKVLFDKGVYFVDFAIRDGETAETALPRIVADTDESLISSQLPATLEEARLAPTNISDYGRVSIEALQQLPDVSPTARELFEIHHSQALETELARLLFEVA